MALGGGHLPLIASPFLDCQGHVLLGRLAGCLRLASVNLNERQAAERLGNLGSPFIRGAAQQA